MSDFPPPPAPAGWGEAVVEFWACVPPPEREAAIAMADTVIALAPFQIKSLVKLAFDSQFLYATDVRWEIWQTEWQVITETIEIDEVEVEVLLCTTEWMFTLAQAFEDGVVPRRPSTRCYQLNFLNKPS